MTDVTHIIEAAYKGSERLVLNDVGRPLPEPGAKVSVEERDGDRRFDAIVKRRSSDQLYLTRPIPFDIKPGGLVHWEIA